MKTGEFSCLAGGCWIDRAAEGESPCDERWLARRLLLLARHVVNTQKSRYEPMIVSGSELTGSASQLFSFSPNSLPSGNAGRGLCIRTSEHSTSTHSVEGLSPVLEEERP
jgi:hypothetical protein